MQNVENNYGQDNTVIGYDAGTDISNHKNVILLGDYIQARNDYEFCLAFGDVEARTIMSLEEWDIMHTVIMRALQNTNKRAKLI